MTSNTVCSCSSQVVTTFPVRKPSLASNGGRWRGGTSYLSPNLNMGINTLSWVSLKVLLQFSTPRPKSKLDFMNSPLLLLNPLALDVPEMRSCRNNLLLLSFHKNCSPFSINDSETFCKHLLKQSMYSVILITGFNIRSIVSSWGQTEALDTTDT